MRTRQVEDLSVPLDVYMRKAKMKSARDWPTFEARRRVGADINLGPAMAIIFLDLMNRSQ
jgi:hypothetical protein